ncbi:YeiH family protein [Streptacidiphilus sp. P02-A3a]|uniref:YeiH family protein n=1 Tax=Streptacidiphilus sp. P02-A3a TaxID=2704468 RepID=UPI0015F9F2F4|nr:putative sulfate exporter family transporter [Streptacidiphilus sp. P02-A3a]QMU73278.1 putative sulfate exporter family transporter [Streptacidiphilus sp. P02-A3a]
MISALRHRVHAPAPATTPAPAVATAPAKAAAPATAPSGHGPVGAALPGLALTTVGVALAWEVNRLLPTVATLTAAVVLGVVARNLRLLPGAARPGLDLAAKRLMRLGIVLLGLKLALGQVLALGWQTLLVVVAVVAATFFGTRWLGRKVGLPGDQALLIATGFSICGASAVAAMNGVTDSDEDDVVTAVALVTLCGSLAIVVLPLLHHPLGLTDPQFGRWAGASVHDVGQVVAVGQTAGPVALAQAVVVKLMRVALLAPIVAGVAVARRRRGGVPEAGAERPAIVPLFVVGFLAMVALRSTGAVPAHVVDTVESLDNLLLAAALFGLGSAVDIGRLVRTGGKALLVGLASWLMIASVAYAGVLLTT